MSGFFSKKEHSFEELVYRGVESDELDYKAHMSWHTMSRAAKGKLLRHLTAFANTRGGFLVIGVGEDRFGNPNVCTGVSAAEAGSFDPSAVGGFINSHIEPPIDFTIERPVIRGKRYVIFVIKPFKELPHVCSNSIEGEIQSGVFYIRTVEASSRPARRAIEMQALIRRALHNERENLSRLFREIFQENNFAAPAEAALRCSDTIEESEHYFRRRTGSFELPQLIVTVEPSNFVPGTFQLETLRKKFLKSLHPDFRFLRETEIEALPTPGSLRYISMESGRMWQLFDSGLFCFFSVIEEPGQLDFADLVKFCALSIDFFIRLYSNLDMTSSPLTLRLEILHPEKISLFDGGKSYNVPPDTSCRADICRSAGELAADPANHASRLACRIGEIFHLPGKTLETLPEQIEKILIRK